MTIVSVPEVIHQRPLQILALAGSLRTESYNRMLLREAVGLAPTDMRVEVYDDLGTLPFFDEDLEHISGDGPPVVRELREKVASADGLLISTPEYNHSFSGVLKNAIEWLSRGRSGSVLGGKPVALVGVTAGAWGTRLAQAAVRQVLFSTESLLLPSPSVFIDDAASRFDSSGALVDERSRVLVRRQLYAFRDWVRHITPAAVEVL